LNDLSTWYLRRSRGRSDNAFFATLYRALIYVSKALAPFTPFISEHIYRNLNHPDFPDSVHLTEWPEVKKITKKQEDLLNQMSEVRKIVERVHATRAKEGIKLRQPLAKLKIPNPKSQIQKELLEILKEEVNVQDIEFGDKLELDTRIDEDLKIAGLARELERQINQFRKESGLKIGETVDLFYETKSANMEKAMQMVNRQKIYAKSFGQRAGQKSNHEKSIDVGGEIVIIFLKISNF